MRCVDISNLTKEQLNAHFLTAVKHNDGTELEWLEAGADVNYGDGDLIIYAMKNDNEELLDKLLEAGAKVNVNKEDEILFFALSDIKWIEKLVNYGLNIHLTKKIKNVKKLTAEKINALGYAYNNDDKKLAMRLLELGIEIDKPAINTAPILLCSIMDENKWLDEILDAGADVNVTDGEGYSALMSAIWYNNKEAFLKLLEAKANVNFENASSWRVHHNSALMMASCYFYVEQLIKNGANVNITTRNGYTVLMKWVVEIFYCYDREWLVEDAMMVIKFLLENGADTSIVANNGANALKLARKTRNKELIKLIKQYSKK